MRVSQVMQSNAEPIPAASNLEAAKDGWTAGKTTTPGPSAIAAIC